MSSQRLAMQSPTPGFFERLVVATVTPLVVLALLYAGHVASRMRQQTINAMFPSWCRSWCARGAEQSPSLRSIARVGSQLANVAVGANQAAPFLSAALFITYLVLPAVSSEVSLAAQPRTFGTRDVA